MTTWGGHVSSAFALGFALGAAPGPVQVLILSETARRGFSGGLRVMLGANGTLFAVLLALALGFSSFTPGAGLLRILRLVGGAFIVFLAVMELRSLAQRRGGAPGVEEAGALGPTAKGVVSVVVNPGAWIFFATTASAVVAAATVDGGTRAAVAVAVAMTVGVSVSDSTFTLLGSGGRRMLGDRGLRLVRVGLSVVLLGLGCVFLWRGAVGR
jgi:threonine/homoserine/homoserine lactone efflux protein